MPYLKEEDKDRLEFDGDMPCSAGELNYVLTSHCLGYLNDAGPPNYSRYNEVIGALECAKLEMYRRAVAPYEDKKIEENGDVY